MPAKGQHHSPESKALLSKAMKQAVKEKRLKCWTKKTSWTKLHKGTGLIKGFTDKHTKKTKAKISNSRKSKGLGNKNALGHTPHNKGKKHNVHTKEWRQKVSAANTREKHWNWKGGISEENQLIRNSSKHKEWSLSVLRRDRWTCQQCGYKVRNIIAHHIRKFSEYKELRFEVSNGITLCRPCHCKLHNPRLNTGKSKFPDRH